MRHMITILYELQASLDTMTESIAPRVDNADAYETKSADAALILLCHI